MSLKKYQTKRKFNKTPEPVGRIKKTAKSRFVVQKHQASHLHYDFRLEMDGVLKSWAVPKGLPDKPKVKRLAVQTEDHPVDYINFKGEIPKGNYGAGTVEIYDKGTYKVKSRDEKAMKFTLRGKKYSGDYVLVNTKGREWIIYKVD